MCIGVWWRSCQHPLHTYLFVAILVQSQASATEFAQRLFQALAPHFVALAMSTIPSSAAFDASAWAPPSASAVAPASAPNVALADPRSALVTERFGADVADAHHQDRPRYARWLKHTKRLRRLSLIVHLAPPERGKHCLLQSQALAYCQCTHQRLRERMYVCVCKRVPIDSSRQSVVGLPQEGS